MSLPLIETCEESTLQEWAESEWGKLTRLIDGCILLLPDEHQIFTYDSPRHRVEFLGGLVTLEPYVYEAKSIRGIHEKPGWIITTWRWTDEDSENTAEFIEEKEYQTCLTNQAVLAAMSQVWDQIVTEWINKNASETESQ